MAYKNISLALIVLCSLNSLIVSTSARSVAGYSFPAESSQCTYGGTCRTKQDCYGECDPKYGYSRELTACIPDFVVPEYGSICCCRKASYPSKQ